MIMTKENKVVEKKDLVTLEEYGKNRRQIRQKLIEYKKNRRVPLGPYATFYFESFDTMLGQIQEMLYIEKGGDSQLKDEMEAYNPLIPKGKELVATLMFEIDNPISRADFLSKVGGIEKKVYMKIAEEKIIATPETDVERTSPEGKASSVQFVRFNFTEKQIEEFRNLENKIIVGIDHTLYSHMTTISKDIKVALMKDFI